MPTIQHFVDPAEVDLDALETRRDAIRRELGREVVDAVRALERERDEWNTGAVVRSVAAHLPGLRGAIFALARHALDDGCDGRQCEAESSA